MKAICFCCKRERPDATPRFQRRDELRGNGVPLCDACWEDPALAFADCKHGGIAAEAAGR